jgi:hypothetical protein
MAILLGWQWQAFSLWSISMPLLYLWGVPMTWWWNVWTNYTVVTNESKRDHCFMSTPMCILNNVTHCAAVSHFSQLASFNNPLCFECIIPGLLVTTN